MTFNLLGPWGHEMFDVDRMRARSFGGGLRALGFRGLGFRVLGFRV